MSEPRKSWFVREVSLGNLLIALPLIGALFVGYGKWSVLQTTVQEHTAAIAKLNESQSQVADALTKLTVMVDERTRRAAQ